MVSIIANRTPQPNVEYPSFSDEALRVRSYFCARQVSVRLAMSAVVVSRIVDGVREKRGAGAGWVTP